MFGSDSITCQIALYLCCLISGCMQIYKSYYVHYVVFFFFRGVSINVLRHEAEFYGITPLGIFVCLFCFDMRSSHIC